MAYVDGFIVPVPKNNIKEYIKLAENAGKIWMDHGALEYKECQAEDVEDKGFCMTFPNGLQGVEDNEVIFISYIVFKSRKHRDEVNKKVMEDERLQCETEKMPFECKRMTYGGFEAKVDF